MTLLSQHSVDTLEGVPVPGYDRDRLTTGIVHFGLGNFHRAHHAMYLDRLMNAGLALDWAICGVGVMPVDQRMRDVMAAQDGLYTLVLKHPDGSLEPRVIGSIHEYLYAPDDPEAVIATLAAPTTRIVSMTITEGGYNTNQVTGEFDLSNPDVRADLEDAAIPRTVFGLVVEALRRRRDAGTAPFTVMSCDNIQSNGEVARRSFTAFARAKDPELADWIDERVAFPNSMVDRITPVTTDEDRALVAATFGIDDAWPVVCEPFVQWVLEEHFTSGRPPYEDAGVQLVADVEPYELMKLRLLNASHQAMAYFGYLSGHRYAHEAATDPPIVELLTRYMNDEATPTLHPVPGIDLDDYKRTLLERFANPEVKDTLARLCAESSDRIPKWLLPVVRANLTTGGDVRLSAAIVASWARYAEGIDEAGEQITVVDRLSATLVPRANAQLDDPLAFLDDATLFGDLSATVEFTEPYLATLADLHQFGAQATLRRLLEPGLSPVTTRNGWLQPSGSYPAEPRWGHANGLQVGLHPLSGPRGLIRVYAPYLADRPGQMINYLAVEPIPAGSTARGYSELEHSAMDDLPGKRFWTSNSRDDAEPRMSHEPASGYLETVDGVEFLRVWLHVEPFDNGARVILGLSFRADRPYEVSVATHQAPGSAPLDFIIVSATMGNYARIRAIELADRIVTPAETWSDFDSIGFTEHARFPASSLLTTPGGGVTASATTDEVAGAPVQYAPGTHEHWKYGGTAAVQTWKVDDADPRLELLVNARRDYWASASPIPGGLAFENFEFVEPFRDGREFTFGVTAL